MKIFLMISEGFEGTHFQGWKDVIKVV